MSKPLRRTMGTTWFLWRGAYFMVWLREVSSFFLGAYLVVFLVFLCKVGEGEAAYSAFMETLRSPPMVGFHVVALAFAFLHTITWFNLTPKAMVVRIGEEKLHPALIAGPNYVLWALVTAFILCVVG